MKILHTADWHIGSLKGPERDGRNLRLEDTINCLEEVVRVAQEEKPELVLISGDVFHQAEIWQGRSHRELHLARGIIKKLADAAGCVVVLRGTPNHDASEIFMSLRETFERFPNIRVITEPQVVQTEYADIVAIPGFDKGQFRAKSPGLSKEEENSVFSGELGNMVTGMKALCRADRMAILMAHYTVLGCNMESGQVQLFEKAEPVITQEMLIAAGYDLVALGHIHRPQRIAGLENAYYSGAVNAFNFNDEGQERGFWIHHAKQAESGNPGMALAFSEFHKTPYREFITVRWDKDDVAEAIANPGMLPMVFAQSGVADKIARVIYRCTEEQKKAVNVAQIERALYEAGAFFKADIKLDALEGVNRKEISRFDDPEVNLIQYLAEKGITGSADVEMILSRARHIIDQSKAVDSVSEFTGAFIPKEICVKNYRNYVEQTFSFEDISFCTINGQNGAGKSSLFMDAIIDCLFEKPREGELTGWVRSGEKVRSGMVSFTFALGCNTFRVVRTRAKSGKGTLNLAQLVDGEWVDRSKEGFRATQAEIEKILGMDCAAFKACVLIMQDQYGVFLEAGKEERIAVLSNLLGLGIYETMERMAKDELSIQKRAISTKKNTVNIHEGTISRYGDPMTEKEDVEAKISALQELIEIQEKDRDEKKIALNMQEKAEEQRRKAQEAVSAMELKAEECRRDIALQSSTVSECEKSLESEQETMEKTARHTELVLQDKEIAEKAAVYPVKADSLNRLRAQISDEENVVAKLNASLAEKNAQIEALQDTGQDAVIRENAAEYERQREVLDKWNGREREFRVQEQDLNDARSRMETICAEYRMRRQKYELAEEEHLRKAKLLEGVDCVDISHAKCAFLADALEARSKVDKYPEILGDLDAEHTRNIRRYEEAIVKAEKKLEDFGYTEDSIKAGIAEATERVAMLQPYTLKLKELEQRERRIALIQTDIGNIRENLHEAEKRLSMGRIEAQELEKILPEYIEAARRHREISEEIERLKAYIERANTYPVIRERKLNAQRQKENAESRLAGIEAELNSAKKELEGMSVALIDIEILRGEIEICSTEIAKGTKQIGAYQQCLGSLNQKIEEISRLREENEKLQVEIKDISVEISIYDLLSAAFSKDGIPHQIIRSLVPKLTEVSSGILGQMTGGKMGIEFRTERTFRPNTNKEVVTLDILIDEYGKPPLPYLSKSGGEKVKASLSVILALSELKASSAGIQMGMLFIDEPPFLDSDGIQAYCDALEAIQNRYPELKIMAITHDPTMKARFPQNLDVVKTEEGSKVIW